MSNGKALAVYHMLCTSQNKPTILHVPAHSKEEAFRIASSAVEDIIVMFATKIKSSRSQS